MTESMKQIYEFGCFRLDAVKRLFWRDGELVPLTPKSLETLLALVERRGEILDKDELLSRIWPGTVVEEKNLTINISTLRKALGESPQDHRYIVTVPGRGYRFVAEVQEITGGETSELMVQQSRMSVVVEEEEVEDDAAMRRRGDEVREGVRFLEPAPVLSFTRGHRLWVGIAAVMLLMASAAYWWKVHNNVKPTISAPRSTIQSLAVLPFKLLNPRSDEGYLGVGMADVMITRLGSLDQLIVRPTRSVLPFASQDPVQAGQTLKVDAVLDGSIQQLGDRVRVTLRLLRVEDGQSLWAYQCDEYCTDVFALQDMISQKVTEALTLKLTANERARLEKRYTDNAEAYQAYLRGRYYYNRVSEDDIKKAIESFNQALRIDPKYALAYAGLSAAYATASGWLWPSREASPKAREFAQKALALDEQLAEAHAALASVRFSYDWQFAEAEQEFKRALALNPGLADAHHGYGGYLAFMGRFDESLAEMKRVGQLDPLSPNLVTQPGLPCYLAGRYDEAIAYNLKGVEIDPNVSILHLQIGITYAVKGEGAKGVAEIQRAIELGDHSPAAQTVLAFAYARAGDRAAAQQTLKRALSSSTGDVMAYFVATAYAALGEREQTFAWLERAYRERSAFMVWLKTDPRWNDLRNDPRFSDLLRRVGFEN